MHSSWKMQYNQKISTKWKYDCQKCGLCIFEDSDRISLTWYINLFVEVWKYEVIVLDCCDFTWIYCFWESHITLQMIYMFSKIFPGKIVLIQCIHASHTSCPCTFNGDTKCMVESTFLSGVSSIDTKQYVFKLIWPITKNCSGFHVFMLTIVSSLRHCETMFA